MRVAEERLMPRMFELAIRTWRQPGIEEAHERFFTDTPVPDDILTHSDYESLFLPWLALRFAPEPPVNRRPAGAARVEERTAAQVLLDEAGDISEFERRFLAAASARPISFCVVADVEPGVSVTLENLLTGTTYRVVEKTASHIVRRGGVVYARVVTLDGVSIMVGIGSTELPPIMRTDIADLRRALSGSDRLMSDDEVLFLEDPVRRWYLLGADTIRNPPPPKFTNTDGDPLVPTMLHFKLRCTPGEAFAALESLNGSVKNEAALLEDAERDETGALSVRPAGWSSRSPSAPIR